MTGPLVLLQTRPVAQKNYSAKKMTWEPILQNLGGTVAIVSAIAGVARSLGTTLITEASGGSTLVSRVLKDILANNLERQLLDFEERVKLTESILEESTDLTKEQIAVVARSFESGIADKLEHKKRCLAENLFTQLRENGVSKDQFYKAIRLSILDPLKEFKRSLAALSGWMGVSDEEIAKLPESERWMAEMTVSLRAYEQLRRLIDRTELTPFSSDFRYEFSRLDEIRSENAVTASKSCPPNEAYEYPRFGSRPSHL